MKLKIWHLLNKTAALAFGVVVVIFMVASQQFEERSSKIDKKDTTEQSAEDDGSEGTFLIKADWVTSISTTQIQPVLNWIRDIELPVNPIAHIYEVIQTGTTQFFQTLFERIISPNAP